MNSSENLKIVSLTVNVLQLVRWSLIVSDVVDHMEELAFAIIKKLDVMLKLYEPPLKIFVLKR